MVHHCLNDPGKNNLIEYVHHIISNNSVEMVDFQQWESTDRTTIVNMVMEKLEFIKVLTKKIDLLKYNHTLPKLKVSIYQCRKKI